MNCTFLNNFHSFSTINIPFLSPSTLPDSKLTLGKPAAQQIFSNKTHKPESTPVSSKLGFCRCTFGLKNILILSFLKLFSSIVAI
uniref:Uncharacterized protein n=1 Tax=Nothobranchius furzeri TaxID=105023 RepID=A0A8C6VYI1_NOTFU